MPRATNLKKVFKAMFIGKIVMIPNDRELAMYEKGDEILQLLSDVVSTDEPGPEVKLKITKILQHIREYKGQEFDSQTRAYFGEI